jgi:hypothetical protein
MLYRESHDECVPWDERARLRGHVLQERAARMRLVDRAALDLADAERTQETEQRAVAELERFGLKRLFLGLAGEIEAFRGERLERLEQAGARVAACRREFDAQRALLAAADAQLASLGDLELGLRDAMQRKAQRLLEDSDGPGAALASLLREADDTRKQQALLTLELERVTVARTELEQAHPILSAVAEDPGVIAASILATLFGTFDEVAAHRAIEAMLISLQSALERVTGPSVAASLSPDERQAIGAIEVPARDAVRGALEAGHRPTIALFKVLSHGLAAATTILTAAIAELGRAQETARFRAEAVIRWA